MPACFPKTCHPQKLRLVFWNVTYPSYFSKNLIGIGKTTYGKKKKNLNHYLKRKCGTVIFIKHGRCPTAHTKESQPDVCRFIHASCYGSLQHFICNGGEARTSERQTKGKCNRNGHFELLEREKVSSSFCHNFFLYTNLLCVKIQ